MDTPEEIAAGTSGAEAPVRLRHARDSDAPGIIDLIGRCYAEYEGCVLCVDEEEPELRCVASSAAFSRFWVLTRAERIVGTVACKERPGVLELKKLYLNPAVRGLGLGRRLVGLIEDYADEHGLDRVELWSDTRFLTAHAVYERLGYRCTGRTRDLHDRSNTTEY